MLHLNLLDQSVSQFFGQVNWDARPQQVMMAPMQFLRVKDFLGLIAWSGDPEVLAARSLATSVAPAPAPTTEDSAFTLSDLFECF